MKTPVCIETTVDLFYLDTQVRIWFAAATLYEIVPFEITNQALDILVRGEDNMLEQLCELPKVNAVQIRRQAQTGNVRFGNMVYMVPFND